MTFEQFQASRRRVEDLEGALDLSIYDDPEIKCPGLIYLDQYYIEERCDNWSAAAKDGGKYHLILNNWDALSDDLEDLERKLFECALHDM